MTNYESALNMPYDAWVNRQAAIDGIERTELEKMLEITPIKAEGQGWATSRKNAIAEFNAKVEDYDTVTDLREGPSDFLKFFGSSVSTAYLISGTAIKRK